MRSRAQACRMRRLGASLQSARPTRRPLHQVLRDSWVLCPAPQAWLPCLRRWRGVRKARLYARCDAYRISHLCTQNSSAQGPFSMGLAVSVRAQLMPRLQASALLTVALKQRAMHLKSWAWARRARAQLLLWLQVSASLIVVLTRGGSTARLVAKYRPSIPVRPALCALSGSSRVPRARACWSGHKMSALHAGMLVQAGFSSHRPPRLLDSEGLLQHA